MNATTNGAGKTAMHLWIFVFVATPYKCAPLMLKTTTSNCSRCYARIPPRLLNGDSSISAVRSTSLQCTSGRPHDQECVNTEKITHAADHHRHSVLSNASNCHGQT